MPTQTAGQFGRRGVVAAKPPATKAPPAPAWGQPSPHSVRGESTLGPVVAVLFSFEGRLDRGLYRLCRIGAYVSTALIGWPLLDTVRAQAEAAGPGPMLLLALVYLGLVCLLVWTTLAMQVKRWHDRDKSGFWAFVGFIPLVGWLWVLVELNFFEGTIGPNRFGPSPKGDPTAVFA